MRGTSYAVESTTPGLIGEDRYYLRRMKEILDAFPNKGPPYYPVQLTSHFYIGNQRNADDEENLKRLGITHVLNCAGTRRFDLSRSPYPSSSGIKGYLMIPAEDHDQYDIMQHFSDAIAFIDKCRKTGGKVLVHCNLGVNRSGALCAAYLMHYERKPLLEITSYLKHKRQFILCNKNFRRQLIRYARAKELLDPVIDTNTKYSNREDQRNGRPHTSEGIRSDDIRQNGEQHRSYSTSSLDRANFIRSSKYDSNKSQASPVDDQANYYSLPRHSRNNVMSSQNYKNSSREHGTNGGNSFQLESVPERKPICDFIPSHSRYDRPSSGSTASLPISAPATPKSVTFRRPTVSDVSKDVPRTRSSPLSSPKLGFLSRIGTKITRQRSLTNISRTSVTDDECEEKPKRSALKTKETKTDDSALSTTRPLRVYKRASTDTELYRKPSSLQSYRRAETLASTDPEMERANQHAHEDHLLPQEYLFHTRSRLQPTSRPQREHQGGSSSVNLLARLKPVSRSRTSSRSGLPL